MEKNINLNIVFTRIMLENNYTVSNINILLFNLKFEVIVIYQTLSGHVITV